MGSPSDADVAADSSAVASGRCSVLRSRPNGWRLSKIAAGAELKSGRSFSPGDPLRVTAQEPESGHQDWNTSICEVFLSRTGLATLGVVQLRLWVSHKTPSPSGPLAQEIVGYRLGEGRGEGFLCKALGRETFPHRSSSCRQAPARLDHRSQRSTCISIEGRPCSNRKP